MKQIHLSKKAEKEEPIRVVESRGTRFYSIIQHEDGLQDEMWSCIDKNDLSCPNKEEFQKEAPLPKELHFPADDTNYNEETSPTPKTEKKQSKRFKRLRKWWWLILPFLCFVMIARDGIIATSCRRVLTPMEESTEYKYLVAQPKHPFARIVSTQSFTEIRDTVIKNVSLRLYLPHNAEMSLLLGPPNEKDTSIVYISQAADIRADNGEIVGAFVLKGEPKAWGLSKTGYCAIIDGEVTIGMEDNTPLFEKATAQEGYFFRQYPLVWNGKPQENAPRGRYTRRALCSRRGEIFMVESNKALTFKEFSTSLANLDIENAIYLVGSTAYGWAIDQDGKRHPIGNKHSYHPTKHTSYIVWRKK